MSEFLLQIVLVLAGAILGVISQMISTRTGLKRMLAGMAVLLVIIALLWGAYAYVVPPKHEELAVPDETGVRITSHRDGEEVPYSIEVTGVFTTIPVDAEIWLYLFGSGSRRYYFEPVILFDSQHTWEVPAIIVGREKEDVGAAYYLGVLLADSKTSNYLHRYPDGPLWSKLDGFKEIPGKTKGFHQITVIRESKP